MAGRWREVIGRLCGALALCLACAVPASATPGASHRTPQVAVRLLAAVTAVYPGETVLLGLEQRLQPHWHTYWRNPGDSGTATRIDWTLPEGVQAGDIHWPVPERFRLGPVTNFGYAGQAVLLLPLTIPESARPGETLPLRAAVNWLVCRDICIPQEAELGLSLPVVATGSRRASSPHAELLRSARQHLPQAQDWPVGLHPLPTPAGSATVAPLELRIQLPPEYLAAGEAPRWQQASFFPAQWGQLDHGAAQPVSLANRHLSLQLTPGEAPPAPGQPLRGLLVLGEGSTGGSKTTAFEIDAVWPAVPGNSVESASPAADSSSLTLLPALLLALLGGLVLNLMPCVFPVLSLKALALVQQGGEHPEQTRRHGLAYTAGVLVSFALLAGALLLVRAAGVQAGWGFQFQSPWFVLAVALLLFGVGLNLSGVFTVGTRLTDIGGALAERPGYAGSFFTGVLATVVATPCTAPFMGAALGFALMQPPVGLLAVFLSLGLGLALPYLALSCWPRLQRHLPRPGAWMERFKQFLAFPMYLTTVWLVWVLARQQGADAVALALAAMVALVFAAWVWEISRHRPGRAARLAQAVALLSVLAIPLAAWSLGIMERGQGSVAAATAAEAGAGREASLSASHLPYTPERLASLRAEGRAVFVNLTADWCITCLVNERTALGSERVSHAFHQAGITYLKGDWTHRDPQISALLARFQRSGVPLYLYYPPGAAADPVVLPQLLTPGIVLDALGLPG